MNKIFFLALMAVVSCTQRTDNTHQTVDDGKSYPYYINLEEGLVNPKTIGLYEIADSIKYVILSKEKDVILRNVVDFYLVDDEIIIQGSSIKSTIHRFDISGRFINSIGVIGRGPGEVPQGSQMAVNQFDKKIVVKKNYTHNSVVFDFEGNFIGDYPVSAERFEKEYIFLDTDNTLMLTYYMGPVKSLPDTVVQGKIVFKTDSIVDQVIYPEIENKYRSQNLPEISTGYPRGVNFFENEPIITNNFIDTIYKANSNGFYNAAVLQRGAYKPNFINAHFYWLTEGFEWIGFYGKALETTSKIYMKGRFQNSGYIFEHDKLSGKTYSMKIDLTIKNNIPDLHNVNFINDFDGGVNFYPSWTNFSGDIWFSSINALDLINQTKDSGQSKNSITQPQKRSNLNEILDVLDIEDNPVLMMVYLKKTP